MDITEVSKKVIDLLKKYRYALIVLMVGIGLMLLPSKDAGDAGETEPLDENITQVSISQQLADILSSVDGAGNVRVFLTVGTGEETLYQTNDSVSVTGDSSSTQIDTVTVTDASKDQTGLIRQVNPPVYQGAIVVCEGADSPSIQLAIVEAVSKVTGLGADCISVLKMK